MASRVRTESDHLQVHCVVRSSLWTLFPSRIGSGDSALKMLTRVVATEWPVRRVVKLELLFFMVLACVLLKDVDGSRLGNGLLSPKAEETVRIFELEQSVRDSLLKMISAYDPVRLTQGFWSPSEDQSQPDDPRILQPGNSLQGVSDE